MSSSFSVSRRPVYILSSAGMAVLLGLAVALTLGLTTAPAPAQAQGSTIYVDDDTCPAGGSGTQLDPYCRIQTAVDAAGDGDEIRVASGRYTGTLEVTAHTGYTYKQVVIITRSLTLRGGYAPGAWDTPDAEANPTIVDAQREGRGISIVGSGTESVTVEGLIVTGGDYTDLGNLTGQANAECQHTGFDCGGGVYAHDVTLLLGTTVVSDNIASTSRGAGGGIYLYDLRAGSRLENLTVISNTAGGLYAAGGGLCARGGYGPTVIESLFQGNAAYDRGGGMHIDGTDGTFVVRETDFLDNRQEHTGSGGGGGLSTELSWEGEALYLDRAQFVGNQAGSSGAAIFLKKLGGDPTSARLTNLFLAGNDTAGIGSDEAVVAIGYGSDFVTAWAHVTAADNQAPTFLCAYAPGSGHSLEVVLTNTIVTSFTYGFVGYQGVSNGDLLIRHTRSLTHQVDTLHHAEVGSPTFEAVSTVGGDPKLVNGYRLDKGSAAEDAGVEAGVDVDIRGKYRPQKEAPDIGCYEVGGLHGFASVGIDGPTTAAAGPPIQFLATIADTSATRPITYVWEATGLEPVTHTLQGFSDTVDFTWSTAGPQVVTATARNVVGQRVATHTLDVQAVPALIIAKTGPDQALIGTPITYTLGVTNAGLVAASDLVITDALPAGAHYVTGGTRVGDVISWSVPSLAGNDGSVEVSCVVTATQIITNADYRVEASGGYSATGAVPLVTRNVYPVLTIAKQGPYSADLGEEIDYLLTVTNTGTGPATDLVITDTLPAGAHYVTGGTRVGDVVSWTIDSLAGGGGTVEVGFTITATQTITNADYRASAFGGYEAQGVDPVVTIVSRGTRYVAPSGSDGLNDCTDSDAPCATIQHAVDVANRNEEVRVAGGTYTGTHRAQASATRAFTQVVYVDDGLTLRGGYAPGAWETPDPQANETIIDAEGSGRGVTIYWVSFNWVILDGFTITGGDYTGLGNPPGEGNVVCAGTGSDCGGGVFVYHAKTIIRNSVITGNLANRAGSGRYGSGGGIYLWKPWYGSRIENTRVVSNSGSDGYSTGGGIYVFEGKDLTVDGCTLQDNAAYYKGGGMFVGQTEKPVIVQDTAFLSNTQQATSGDGGGGLAAQVSYAGEALRLDRVRFAGNVAHSGGGAIFLDTAGSDEKQVRLNNLLLTGNRTPSGDGTDGVVAVARSYRLDLILAHVTAADNPAPTFLRAEAPRLADNALNVVLTNTLVSSATYAFVGSQPIGEGALFITHTRTFTYDVSTLHHVATGSPVLQAVDPLGGDPQFDADHHLQPASPARDAGIDAGVVLDLDGDARIDGSPDVGADEVEAPGLAVAKWADPGSVEGGERLTYTLLVTNTGNVELHATVTDTLPTQVTPGGELVWTPTITAPGGVWTEQVVVTAPTGYTGELANVVQVVAAEGPSGMYTETSTVISGCTGLTGVNFDWAPGTPTMGTPVQFTAWVTPAQPASYIWDLGGQAVPTGNPVSHTFAVSDTYTIVVTATGGCGAPVRAEHVVSVESRSAVYLPLVLCNP